MTLHARIASAVTAKLIRLALLLLIAAAIAFVLSFYELHNPFVDRAPTYYGGGDTPLYLPVDRAPILIRA